jgi:hypothetical protein
MTELERIDSYLNPSSDLEELKIKFLKLEDVLKRNPALLLTAELHDKINRQRKLLMQLREQIAYAVRYSTGVKAMQAQELKHLARPYFTPYPSRQCIIEVFTNGGKLATELMKPAIAPLLESLGLAEQVEAIHNLNEELIAIYRGRDSEIELRHLEGSATKLRPAFTNILERVLYAVLQTVYTMSHGESRRLIEGVILSINGAIDSFTIYTRRKPTKHTPELPNGGNKSGNNPETAPSNGSIPPIIININE